MAELTKSRQEDRDTRSLSERTVADRPIGDALHTAVFDSLRYGLFVFDAAGRLAAVNRAGKTILR